MLEIKNIHVQYQELRALRGVSLTVKHGDLAALIGSNGAGKTTLLNTVSGLISPVDGRISWQGEPLSGLPPDEICHKGIIQVPEGRKLFAMMTVEENLEMGAYSPSARAKAGEGMNRVFEIFPNLAERCFSVAQLLFYSLS